MRARWGAALAAALALAASAVARAADDGTCELSRVDRRHTTSRSCMTCHDGTGGKAVSFGARATGGLGPSHPVEVDYAAVAAAHPDRFRPAGSLPFAIPLVRGRIECTTCHDGASTSPGRVPPIRDLCLTCHNL
jgi:hypothetical protein